MSFYLAAHPQRQPWQEQAVTAVAHALCNRHLVLGERLAARSITDCREDIHRHLEYLDSALATGDVALFIDYAHWINAVLTSRGVASEYLSASFELLGAFLCEQIPPAQGLRAVALVTAAREALASDEPPCPSVPPRVPALPEATGYRQAALSGNHHAAERLMSAAMQAGSTLSEASVRLVQPAMYEVGRLWQDNRITVSQEHLATAISQNVLARAYMEADFAPPIGRIAMFASVAHNHHSLGVRMLADAFETIGWEALFLGADVPTRDLIEQVDASRPELLCLSVCLPSHLVVAREASEAMRAELGNRCPTIWVGGQATLSAERVWRSVKADGWAADALHALEQVVP